MTTERTLPHDLDAERAVLGAILLHGDQLSEAAEHLTAAHFFRQAHREIYEHLTGLAIHGVEIDYLTLVDALDRSGKLEAIGGRPYLTALVDGLPARTHIAEYARIVREKADLRAIILAAQHLQALAFEGEDTARAVLDRAEQVLFEIAEGREAGGFKRLSAILPALMAQIEAWHQEKGITGLPTGLRDFDELTRGLQPANLILIAARPSMGKSALALNIAQHVAGLGKTVGLFSLEMSEEELGIRTITAEARVDGHRLQRGYLGERDFGRLAMALGKLGTLPVFIDATPFITIFEMRSRARRLKAQAGLDLLIVDYMQLMEGDPQAENRNLALAGISRGLKALAKDLGIPVIVLSQVNRQCETRADKRPLLADLRDSGALEQDADLVVFIYRDEVYNPGEAATQGLAELILAKQRNGPIGTVKVCWMKQYTRFENLATDFAEDRRLPMGER